MIEIRGIAVPFDVVAHPSGIPTLFRSWAFRDAMSGSGVRLQYMEHDGFEFADVVQVFKSDAGLAFRAFAGLDCRHMLDSIRNGILCSIGARITSEVLTAGDECDFYSVNNAHLEHIALVPDAAYAGTAVWLADDEWKIIGRTANCFDAWSRGFERACAVAHDAPRAQPAVARTTPAARGWADPHAQAARTFSSTKWRPPRELLNRIDRLIAQGPLVSADPAMKRMMGNWMARSDKPWIKKGPRHV